MGNKLLKMWSSSVIEKVHLGTSLVVLWLKLWAPNAGGPGSNSGQGTRCYMLQLKVHMPQLKKIPHAATKQILDAKTKIKDNGCCN